MQLHQILNQANPCFTSLPVDAALDQALTALARFGKTAVIVMQKGKIKGILTRTDVVAALGTGRRGDLGEKTIAQLMTRDLIICDALSSFDHALDRMAQSNIEHLPVVENERLLTVVHERDLMRFRFKALQDDIEQLREYIEHLHNATQD
jgi:CBS domain-containing protein